MHPIERIVQMVLLMKDYVTGPRNVPIHSKAGGRIRYRIFTALAAVLFMISVSSLYGCSSEEEPISSPSANESQPGIDEPERSEVDYKEAVLIAEISFRHYGPENSKFHNKLTLIWDEMELGDYWRVFTDPEELQRYHERVNSEDLSVVDDLLVGVWGRGIQTLDIPVSHSQSQNYKFFKNGTVEYGVEIHNLINLEPLEYETEIKGKREGTWNQIGNRTFEIHIPMPVAPLSQ